MKAFDRFLAALPAVPAIAGEDVRWPTARSVQRARKVYRFIFWFAAVWSVVFLAFGGLSLPLAASVTISLIGLGGWASAWGFAEGYQDGAKHAVEAGVLPRRGL